MISNHTLHLYAIAAAMNLGLSLVLLAFAHLQPGTLMTRRLASSLLVLAVAFFVAAYETLLPTAVTIMAPVLVMAAGVLVFCGVSAFCAQRQPKIDWLGWTLVAIGMVAIGYWGLIEPNGHYRAAVFSFTTGVINGRSAWSLVQTVRRSLRRWSLTLLSLMFVVLSIWMFCRGLILLFGEMPSMEDRGANPTQWTTMVGYIVFISLFTGNMIWVEIDHYKANFARYGLQQEEIVNASNATEANLRLLWSIVIILCLGVFCELLMVWQANLPSSKPTISGLTTAAMLLIVCLLVLAFISTRALHQRETEARFLAMLAHELKTPLSVIRLALGCAELSTTLKAQTLRSVEDMNAIIERCLLANRLRDGHIDQLRKPCNVELTLRSQCSKSIAPERIELALSALPTCQTDPELLAMVFSNLLDNALKYGLQAEPIHIMAQCCHEHGQHGIQITFSNSVAPKRLPDPRRLFTQYYRGAWSHETSGSGIGLYLCKHLMQALGGNLHYQPEGNRVHFTVWLPL